MAFALPPTQVTLLHLVTGPHALGFSQALTLRSLLTGSGQDETVSSSPLPATLLPTELPFGL